ncbi:hypothetical protein ATK78_0884 [Pedobacter metabolipauper]|uniref:Uncharacterized protein n=2 Tax=Pedobacter metabolipauper TaxID=425513 RepID=A0A4R6SZ74_9SPHI|nr:hypothetical protein ATK78_0884 [Pedobacter metabolipauper]
MISCQKKAPQKIAFEKAFQIKDEIVIKETEELKLSGVQDPLKVKDKIYIPSYSTNRIYVCDLKGNLTDVINKNDELALRLPSQIGFYREKIYVNDQGNHQIQVLDLNYKKESIIKILGQTDKFFLIRDKADKLNILAHGTQRDDKEVVLFKKFNDTYQQLLAFASPPRANIATWRSCLDSAENVYHINIIYKNIDVYNINGEYLRKIELNSPTLETLLDSKKLDDLTPTEIIAYLEDKSYAFIRNINIYKDYIFIQYENSVPKTSKYVLDIFNTNGDVIFPGIEMDDLILGVEKNKMTTLNNEVQKSASDKSGKITLKEYQIAL